MLTKHITFFCILTVFLQCCASQLILRPDYPTSTRIVGGTVVTNRTQFAYQISVRIKTVTNPIVGSHICGGSIISPKYSLGAAHCVITSCTGYYVASQFVLVAGDLNTGIPSATSVYRNVTRIFAHSDYNPMNYRFDIAVFEVASDWPLDGINLAAIPLTAIKPTDGVDCRVAGWGHTQWQGVASQELLYVDLKLLHGDVCRQTYNPENFTFVHYKEDHLCAGHTPGGKGSCQGDSGGALVCDGVQAGIVSFGVQCALEGIPTVYANVAFFAPWLRNITGLTIAAAPHVTVPSLLVLLIVMKFMLIIT